MKHPKISVIVTSFNIEKYIAQCLESLKGQSFSDFECIVVDDGSTDTTKKIIRNVIKGDKRFKTLFKENGGVSTARNAGFAIAKGEYVLFLDGDDFFSSNMLTGLYEKAVENNADIVACNFIQYFDRMQKFGDSKIDFSVFGKEDIVSYETHPDVLFGTLTFMFWNKLIRTEFLKETGIRNNETLHRAQDIDFFGRLLVSTKRISYIDEPLVNYRTDMQNSNVNRLYKYPNNVVIALTNVKHFLEEKKVYERVQKGFFSVVVDHVLANLYFTETHSVHKEVYRNAKKLVTSLDVSYDKVIKDDKTLKQVRTLLESDYEVWLQQRIIDLRDDGESKYISYLLGEYQRKYEDAQNEVDHLRSSVSWKVTRPLRKIHRIVRRK